MKYQTWKQSTENLELFNQVNQLILEYKLARTDETLGKLEHAAHELETKLKKPVEPSTLAKLKELNEWIETRKKEENDNTFKHLQTAAAAILEQYHAYFPEHYLIAIKAVFINPDKGVRRCYKYFSDKGKWENHIRKLEPDADDSMIQHADGVTPTFTLTSTSTKNLVNDQAPYNRRVEFRDPIKHHTLVHELLHWSCHEQFRLDTLHYPIAKEGITEWLARQITKVTLAGWEEKYREVETAIYGGADKAVLFKAYFMGEKTDSVVSYLIDFRRKGEKKKKLQSLNQLLFVAGRKAPSPQLKGTWGEQVQKAFDDFGECKSWAEENITSKYQADWINWFKELF